MKKVIVLAVMMVGIASFAQEKTERPERKERPERVQFTPAQRNELRIKELTLKLDLSASQQKDMGKLMSEMDAKHEANRAERLANKDKKPTSDEIFAKRTKMLDDQIAMKERVKKILKPEQMDKWEKMAEHRKADFKGNRNHDSRKGRA